MSSNLNNRLFLCAGNGEEFKFATSIGVGLINSAMNLTRILERMGTMPSEIVFVGTCGIYGAKTNSNLNILDVFETTFAANVEISQLLGLAYTPVPSLDVPRETNPVNCSNFITTDSAASAKLAALGFVAENMEFFAVREVATAYSLPVRAVLCATNYCDENAHEDFLAHRAIAKSRLENYLKERKFI